MSIASFAGKAFEASRNKIYTFDGLTASFGLITEEQDVEGKKPSTYIKGKNLESISFDVKLIQSKTVNVEKEINAWRRICNAAIPYMLFTGGKPVINNKFLLISVNLEETLYSAKGKLVKAVLKLEFKEYVRRGVKKND